MQFNISEYITPEYSVSPAVFFSFSAVAAGILVLLVAQLLGSPIAIKASYGLIGILLAASIYYSVGTTASVEWDSRIQTRQRAKLVYLLLPVSIIGITVTNNRLLVLLMVLPVGYGLLWAQLRSNIAALRLLPQIVVLFVIPPLTLYLNTGLYFSKGDTLGHLRIADTIIQTGTTASIPTGNFYGYFPGLHLLVGTLKFISGMSIYDSLMITGMLTFVSLVLVAFLLAKTIFEDAKIAVFVALAATLLEPIQVWTSYFIPQAFAVSLLMFLVFVAYRFSWKEGGLIAIGFVGAFTFAHHLTLILFLPIIALLIGVPVGLRSIDRSGFLARRPTMLPLILAVVSSVLYWYFANVFIGPFISSLTEIVERDAIGSQSGVLTSTFVGGVELQPLTPGLAAASLVSPEGVYYILLVAFFMLGAAVILADFEQYRIAAGAISVGILSAPLLFRTPLTIVGIQRSRLPLSFFFAFVLGISLFKFVRHGTESTGKKIAIGFVFVSLVTAAPIVSGHDLYTAHSGPALWEMQPTPEPQKEFTVHEYRSLREAGHFIERYDAPVTTDWKSDNGLRRFDVDIREQPRYDERARLRVTDDTIRLERGLLLYRERWPDHSIVIIPERLQQYKIILSDAYFDEMTARHDKIYDTGSVGMIRSEHAIEIASRPERADDS